MVPFGFDKVPQAVTIHVPQGKERVMKFALSVGSNSTLTRRLPPSLATTVQSARLERMEKAAADHGVTAHRSASSSGAVDQAYRNASPHNSGQGEPPHLSRRWTLLDLPDRYWESAAPHSDHGGHL